jgi:hypothetical protein
LNATPGLYVGRGERSATGYRRSRDRVELPGELLSVAAARSHVPDLDLLVVVVDAVADGLRNLFEPTVES